MRLPASCIAVFASLLAAASPSLAAQKMAFNGKPTVLSEPHAALLRRDLGRAAGTAGNMAYHSLKPVVSGGVVGACGLVDTRLGRLPFTAFLEEGQKKWIVSIAKNTGSGYFATFSVCSQMGAVLPGWNEMLNPVNVGAAQGNAGNVTLTGEQRTSIERGVARKIGLSAPAKVRGLVARQPASGKKVTWVCGFGFDGKRYVPFLGIVNGGKDGKPSSFNVAAIGGTPATTFAAHNICAQKQIKLPGRI